MQMMQQFDVEKELNQLQFAALQFESINAKKYSNSRTTNTSQSAFAAQSSLNYMRDDSQREEREERRDDTSAIKRCYNCDDTNNHMTSTCTHCHVFEHASLD